MPIQVSKASKTFFVLFILLIIAFLLVNFKQDTAFDQFFFGAKNYFFPKTQKANQVQEIIQKDIAKNQGNWAIAIEDLKTGDKYFYHEKDVFPSASLYKLAVMWATFDALEKDQLKDDEELSSEKSYLDKILQSDNSDAALQNTSPEEKVSSTVKNALEAMITVSDNYSAVLLAQRLGWTDIDSLMEKEGLSGIDLTEKSPSVTAEATLDLLERIYRNKAVSWQASEKMKKLLFNQKINDRIPKYLPEEVKVGHKTGELGQVKHDAGIILGKNSHYIFVFLSETQSPQDAAETIAKLSQKIYEALENANP